MAVRLNKDATLNALRAYLAGVESATARDLTAHLRVSQPVFSRLVASLSARSDDSLLVIGRARATRYALRRDVPRVGARVPIYEVTPAGETQRLATLHALARGFYVDAPAAPERSGFYPGLPYFLHDMRPSGFLGRMLPARHPELRAPADILLWSDDDCLRYFTRFGWDLTGNLLVGDETFRAYLQQLQTPPQAIDPADRPAAYAQHAHHVLQSGVAGSSAAGEHPKFLATIAPGQPVLVKFSPPIGDAVGRRVADLLWCEHLMHGLLAQRGWPSARSELLPIGDRVFLQVERFDRQGAGGRHGLISLAALDLHFVGGQPHGWVESARALARAGEIATELLDQIRWLALLGHLIGNNDMHGGNLAFLCRSLRPYALAPVYDMLPMLYAPYQGNVPARTFTPPLPTPADADIWESACAAALAFWQQVATHLHISASFRDIAADNARRVADAARFARHLPR